MGRKRVSSTLSPIARTPKSSHSSAAGYYVNANCSLFLCHPLPMGKPYFRWTKYLIRPSERAKKPGSLTIWQVGGRLDGFDLNNILMTFRD